MVDASVRALGRRLSDTPASAGKSSRSSNCTGHEKRILGLSDSERPARHSSIDGGRMLITDAGGPVVRHNRISGNHTEANGGGIEVSTVDATIVDNVITGNDADDGRANGGGIDLGFTVDRAAIGRNVIEDNTALSGGGISMAACTAGARLLLMVAMHALGRG